MMNLIYGPFLYFSVAVFFIGMLYNVVKYIMGLSQKLDRVAYKAHWGKGLVGAFLSIIKWMIPGGTRGWRVRPITTFIFFLFHCGAILLPFFLLQHAVIIENMFGISLPTLPTALADTLSVMSIIGLVGLAVRRITVSYVRALTTPYDWFILILAALPFVTGVMFRFSTSTYECWEIIHIISAEIFLILAPFTKLNHMVLYFMSRAQIGMDFAIKRGGQNRGPVFPW